MRCVIIVSHYEVCTCGGGWSTADTTSAGLFSGFSNSTGIFSCSTRVEPFTQNIPLLWCMILSYTETWMNKWLGGSFFSPQLQYYIYWTVKMEPQRGHELKIVPPPGLTDWLSWFDGLQHAIKITKSCKLTENNTIRHQVRQCKPTCFCFSALTDLQFEHDLRKKVCFYCTAETTTLRFSFGHFL